MLKKVLIILFTPIVFLFFIVYLTTLNFENYHGWHKETIPTNTVYKGTIKIPNEWHFTSIDNIIYIKNGEDETIASQVYSQFRYFGTLENPINDWESLNFNSVEGLEVKDESNYEYLSYDTNTASFIYKYDDGENINYCMQLTIFNESYINDNGEKKYLSYYLFLIFDSQIEKKQVIKIAKSYTSGGWH